MVLIMAEKWHTPPWEIAGGDPLEWMQKQAYLDEQRAKLKKQVTNGGTGRD